jgi:2-polyprenyl-6-methoxyphenol hydroxylase-like FAD-dependent oxidoreductase
MTPVGGVGINYAIQDAVVAANVLSGRLKQGQVPLRDLAKIQRQREWPARVIQAWQILLQQQLLAAGALDSTKPFRVPAFLRLPILRSLFPRWMGCMIGIGVWPVQVEIPHRAIGRLSW